MKPLVAPRQAGGTAASLNGPSNRPLVVVHGPSIAGELKAERVSLDQAAYDRCVKAHSEALYRFVVKNLGDRDEAKDIVQESLLRLWMKRDSVADTGARSYLFTTAQNLIVDRSRRRKYLTRYEDAHEDVLTTQQPKAGLRDAIEGGLARLSKTHRRLILLRDLEGHSYEAISAITGLDLTKVRVYLYRARKTMKSHLGDLAEVI